MCTMPSGRFVDPVRDRADGGCGTNVAVAGPVGSSIEHYCHEGCPLRRHTTLRHPVFPATSLSGDATLVCSCSRRVKVHPVHSDGTEPIVLIIRVEDSVPPRGRFG